MHVLKLHSATSGSVNTDMLWDVFRALKYIPRDIRPIPGGDSALVEFDGIHTAGRVVLHCTYNNPDPNAVSFVRVTNRTVDRDLQLQLA